MTQLSELLGAAPPDGVTRVAGRRPGAARRLIAAARQKQAADLEAAFAATLKHVPFPVRGLAKKMLLG